jgi:hypothetical protein
MQGQWSLLGFDTFSGAADPENSWYPISGSYATEAEAQAAAFEELKESEDFQPESESGGQDGIQDHVYIVRPDGSSYRFLADDPKDFE